MHIVVIGLGEVGRHLLSVLQSERHDLVAVDVDPAAVAYAEEHYDCATLVGYGASQETLDQAGVARADLVVACSDHDEVNLIAALAAKQLGAKRVVARAQGNEWSRWTEGIRHGLLGVDVVINPRVLVGQELARVARSHGAVDIVDLAQKRLELVQIHLGSHGTGVPLSELPLPKGTLIGAYVREGALVVPGGQHTLERGDSVYLIGLPHAVRQAEELFSSRREADRIAIIGGGVAGQALARQVRPLGTQVTIVERDPRCAEQLAQQHEDLTVVLGDGTDAELLEEIEIATYDLVACVTSADEVNLMSALIAKRAGAPSTAALVNRADYAPIYRQLGIDIVLSPRTVASDHILRFARHDAIHRMHVLEGGAEVLEVVLDGPGPVIGKRMRELRLPKGALFAAIVRGEELVVPRGDDSIEKGDRVIAIVIPESRAALERLLRVRG